MDHLSKSRRDILELIKANGPASTAEISDELSISYEAVRQQIVQLEKQGLIDRHVDRENQTAGRPVARIALTEKGENAFPKSYDALAVEMIDTVAEDLGEDALADVLERFTERRVRKWRGELEGLPLEEKLEKLRDLYAVDDPFTEVVRDEGQLYLIERNCPFLNVAKRRPALCSVTVSTLQRLLGYRVERVKRFQNGDGYCAFRVRTDEPLESPPPFSFEASGDDD